MNTNMCKKNSSWVVYTLLIFAAIWIQNVNCDDARILAIYKDLYDYYKKHANGNANTIKSDCNVKDVNTKDREHHNWGTLTTMQYLSENENDTNSELDLKDGEILINRAKLRLFLIRLGYLKVPGSLVFLNKQAETLKLEGCRDTPRWRLQGEKGMEKDFYETGVKLKINDPNEANYVHKFTCSLHTSCSHTFYVITKPLPEVPLNAQIREGEGMKDDSYELNCAVPYCKIEDCNVGNTDHKANRRSYPPYTITWNLKSRNPDYDVYQGKKKTKIIEGNQNAIIAQPAPGNIDNLMKRLDIVVIWDKKIRKDNEAPVTEKNSYQNVKAKHYIDAFGDDHQNPNLNFNSRLIIKKPEKELHSGTYECIIEDGNGIVSTPNVFPGDRDWEDYRGRISVFVINQQLYLAICFGTTAACIVLVAIIILVCPKKMEYDDGTPYTKEELVSPSKKPEAELRKDK